MSPTKMLWLCAAAIVIGIATNTVGLISLAIVVTVMATTAEVVFCIIRRSSN